MLEHWIAPELERAYDELKEALNPEQDGPGRWATAVRQLIRERIERLYGAMTDQKIHTPDGMAQFYMLKGEIEGLKVLLKEDFGIGRRMKELIEKAKKGGRDGSS